VDRWKLGQPSPRDVMSDARPSRRKVWQLAVAALMPVVLVSAWYIGTRGQAAAIR
jgi:hypothetical protein